MKKRYLRLVRRTFRFLRHRRLRHRPWWQSLTRPLFDRALWMPCRDTVATGLAIGLFFSVMPIPFQMVPSALLAMRARANVPFAMAACWISNPLTTLPIVYLQFQLGEWMRHSLGVPMPKFLAKVNIGKLTEIADANVPHFLSKFLDFSAVGSLNAASFILGFMTSGVLLALCAYPLVHLFSALLPHHLPVLKRKPRTRPFRTAGQTNVN